MLTKGEKTNRIREALEKIGANVSITDCLKWIEEKYGEMEGGISDSTFYKLRKDIREATPPQKPVSEGVASLVSSLKKIVEKIGKQETKDLVDIF